MSTEPSPATPRVSRSRRILLAVGGILLLLLALAAIRIAPLVFAPNVYAGTPSIEGRADYRDPSLLSRAWQLPVASAYRRFPFQFQDNPSFCGPTSVANLLGSLGIQRSQHDVLRGTGHDPLFGVLPGGLTLDELADVLRQTGIGTVVTVRTHSLGEFRAAIARSNDPAHRLIVNFHRGPLFGRGHGHFSPVLGYLQQQDLVLVGDVNADYRPFLVPTDRLWAAVDTLDEASGQKRGLLMVDVGPLLSQPGRPLAAGPVAPR